MVVFIFHSTARAHEAWELPSPPEMMSFAKKMQIGGYYSTAGVDPEQVGMSTRLLFVFVNFLYKLN